MLGVRRVLVGSLKLLAVDRVCRVGVRFEFQISFKRSFLLHSLSLVLCHPVNATQWLLIGLDVVLTWDVRLCFT